MVAVTGWVRLWHDMPTDPKWRTIARKSGQRVGDVIAVFNFVMVCASKNDGERGSICGGFDIEDVATAIDIDETAVSAILEAMQGKVLDGQRLRGWEKRQPKREDSTAAKRKAEWKERQAERSGTQDNAEERPETETETEVEKTEANASAKKRDSRGDRLPEDWEPKPLTGKTAEMVAAWPAGMIERELAKFKDHFRKTPGARGRSLDWDASWRNWLRTADERVPRNDRTNRMARHQPADGLSATSRAAMRFLGQAGPG